MADGGELGAAFRALAEDAAQAGENVGKSMSRFFEDTAEREDQSVATHLAAEEEKTRLANSIRSDANPGSLGGSGEGATPSSGSAGGRSELSKMLNGDQGEQAAESAAGESKYTPEFLQLLKDWREGRKFNEENAHRFPHNEVHLKSRNIVDSYVPRKEIVERKNAQLSEIDEKTAKSYIDSLRRKYKAGQRIGDTPKNRAEGIAGSKLTGKHILEVPKQVQPVPRAILEHAKLHRVTIRDVHGTVYELPKEAG